MGDPYYESTIELTTLDKYYQHHTCVQDCREIYGAQGKL